MNLQEIRLQVSENLGFKVEVGDTRLTRMINRAIEHVTNLVELQNRHYNMVTTPITVTVVGGTKEYTIADYSAGVKIRKIVKAERTDNSTDPVDVELIDFRDKNRYSRHSNTVVGQLTGGGTRPIVYVRRDSVGDWFLGFPSNPGEGMTLKVYYATILTSLTTDSQSPTSVPDQHHDAIVTRSTVTLLMQLGQDPSVWMAREAELQNMLVADLSTWNHSGPWKRRRSRA